MSIKKVNMKFVLAHPDLEDVLIPISSLAARIREGSPSYLQVIIPNYVTYADTILARLQHCRNSELVIYKVLDGVTELEVLTVDLETLRFDRGSLSQSIFLTGHRTFYNQAPKTVTITDAEYIRTGTDTADDETHRIRCSAYNNVSAGDTAIYTYGGETFEFVVELLTLTANSYGFEMEISSG